MRSLFDIMKANKLTTMKIRYDYKRDKFAMYAAREWPDDIDFSQYNKSFSTYDILFEKSQYLNSEACFELCRKHGAFEYLEEIFEMMRSGKHTGIDMYYLEKYDIRFALFAHSRIRGLHNKSRAALCGGTRRHLPGASEKEVFVDGLKLSRAASYKNTAAQIPFGGSKTVVQMEELDLENKEVLGFLGYATENCSVITAPDMNFPIQMVDALKDNNYSLQFVGGKKSKVGPTGKPTAYGVYLSLKEAVKFREGTGSLDGKSVLVIGLGAVGWPMAEYLLAEKVRLHITDINGKKAEEFMKSHPGREITVVDAEHALEADADIISPCATGGILTKETISGLKCKYVWGSANNQLKALTREEEYELAGMLHDRGILFEADWLHNPAGNICIVEEYMYDGNEASLMKKIEEILPAVTHDIVKNAEASGITPTEYGYMQCESLLY